MLELPQSVEETPQDTAGANFASPLASGQSCSRPQLLGLVRAAGPCIAGQAPQLPQSSSELLRREGLDSVYGKVSEPTGRKLLEESFRGMEGEHEMPCTERLFTLGGPQTLEMMHKGTTRCVRNAAGRHSRGRR